MKSIIRLILFTFLSVKTTQYVIGSYNFDSTASVYLFIIALSVLFFFIKPLLRITSLPTEGAGFIFMGFLLTFITTHVLTLFIPNFSLRSTVISELIIFGFVLPSKHLTAFWANVFSALLFTVLMWFFEWVSDQEG